MFFWFKVTKWVVKNGEIVLRYEWLVRLAGPLLSPHEGT